MCAATPISYQPTDGLTYDPEDEKYWQAEALAKEVRRAFEICHGCRMCFKYCDLFPTLFSRLDRQEGSGVDSLSQAETDGIMQACFQCKLCEVQCPYTPRDGHAFQLDFPKLVHRYQAVRAKRRGISWRDRVLGNPDLAATAARASCGIADVMNRVRAHRWIMEKVLGIHRAKLLPAFTQETFERWAEKAGRTVERPAGRGDPEVVLFQTCYVQNSEPQIGRDTLEVLARNQVRAAAVKGLQCCGMPAWEHGDLATLRRQAAHNLAILQPFVAHGASILAINPTCAMLMRREYEQLLPRNQREAARALAMAVMDPSTYLWSIRDQARFNTDFKSTPGTAVAYHTPCHLRAQAVGFKGRDLLRKIPGVVPRTVMECCGHNGTYAMTTHGFEASRKIGQKAFDGMQQTGAQVWVSDCPLAALQFQQHAGTKPLHPMSLLARAYREDGFPVPAPAKQVE